jgi:hypothetical protein
MEARRLVPVEYRDDSGVLHAIQLDEAQVAALVTVATYTGSDLATVVAELIAAGTLRPDPP